MHVCYGPVAHVMHVCLSVCYKLGSTIIARCVIKHPGWNFTLNIFGITKLESVDHWAARIDNSVIFFLKKLRYLRNNNIFYQLTAQNNTSTLDVFVCV